MDAELESTCGRVSGRELGIQLLRFKGILGEPYFWKPGEHDSPNARPVSLYAVMEPLGKIPESESRRFFPLNGPPFPLIGGSHQHFFANWRRYHLMARMLGFI